jgi:hypothetical protein
MDVSEHPQISDVGAIEREYGSSVPPHVIAARRHAEEFASVVAMEPQLTEDLVALLSELQDVGCVFVERPGDKLDIANDLLMTYQLLSK